MEKRALGKTGMEVSVLGFGGAEIGYENVPQDVVAQLLNAALDAGLNVIDTAECYADSEEKIGQSVSHRRNDFFLFTKAGHPEGEWKENYSRGSLLESIERSLRRLRVDHVDLVQLHSCSETVLREGEAIGALEEARAKGHTRFIGYSGDGAAARFAVECGRFDVLQTSINIADQQVIELTVPLASEREMGVIAKRPIANAAWRSVERPKGEYYETYWERLQRLEYDFLSGDRAAEIALRFTSSVPGVHTAIVGTTKPDRWQQNAQLAARGPLPEEQFEAIRARWRNRSAADWVGQT